jgi:hypothetical protein
MLQRPAPFLCPLRSRPKYRQLPRRMKNTWREGAEKSDTSPPLEDTRGSPSAGGALTEIAAPTTHCRPHELVHNPPPPRAAARIVSYLNPPSVMEKTKTLPASSRRLRRLGQRASPVSGSGRSAQLCQSGKLDWSKEGEGRRDG